MAMEIRRLPFDSPEAVAFNVALQAEYRERYGGTDETPVAPQEFAPPHGDFLVAAVDGESVGCGGFRIVAEGVAEIKRMYVKPFARGHGIARGVLAALELSAASAGCNRVILETGSKQPEAVALYDSGGYTIAPAFGTYSCEPGSRHLGKDLPGATGVAGLLDRSEGSRMSG